MLLSLPYDMLIEIVRYLRADEFKTVFMSLDEKTQNEVRKYTVECKTIISDCLVKWFEDQNIKIKLKKTLFMSSLYNVQTLYNGKVHSFDDKPAYIKRFENHECKMWYKNGSVHRDNDLPAVINFYGQKRWYQNGVLFRANGLPCIEYTI
jgi:hypothetical protein